MAEKNPGRLEGKAALITGGRQGIGRAIVDRFIEEGASVMTCGRGERPDDLPEQILWQTADVANVQDIRAIKQTFESNFGPLSVLVNNAGVQIEKIHH